MRRLLPPPSGTAGAGAAVTDLATEYAWPAGRWLRASMVSSLDGATAGPDGRSATVSGPPDRPVFHHLRRSGDAILVGAGTVRAEGYRPAAVPIAVVSAGLTLDLSAPLFREAEHRTVVVTTTDADADRVRATAAVADVVAVGAGRVDLAAALTALAARGLAHVVCEGGPRLLGELAAADLIDEYCVSVSPLVAGGDSPRLLAGVPLAEPRLMALVGLCEDDGFLFARYRRRPA